MTKPGKTLGLHRGVLNGPSVGFSALGSSPSGGPFGGPHGHPGKLLHHSQGAQDGIRCHEGRQWKMGKCSLLKYRDQKNTTVIGKFSELQQYIN